MKVDRRFLYWGVFLVTAGAVALIAQSDAVGVGFVGETAWLWPAALIALGVGLVLRQTRFGLAGGMLAAAMPGLLLGGVIGAAPEFTTACGETAPTTSVAREGTFEGRAAVELVLACGESSVTTAPGTGWRLQTGAAGRADAIVDAAPDRLTVRSAAQRHMFGIDRGGDAWRLSLPTANQLDLTAEVDAGRGLFDLAGARLGDARFVVRAADARVDLTNATVDRLSVSVDAGAASVRLPAASDVVADLSVNAGAISICAPDGVGLRVHQTAVLASTRYRGLAHGDETWESPDYSISNHHADVTVSANVGSVDINPLGGCK